MSGTIFSCEVCGHVGMKCDWWGGPENGGICCLKCGSPYLVERPVPTPSAPISRADSVFCAGFWTDIGCGLLFGGLCYGLLFLAV